MSDEDIEARSYYLFETGGVYQVTGASLYAITLTDPATGQVVDVRREEFVEGLEYGTIQRVEPDWQLVDAGGQKQEAGA